MLVVNEIIPAKCYNFFLRSFFSDCDLCNKVMPPVKVATLVTPNFNKVLGQKCYNKMVRLLNIST